MSAGHCVSPLWEGDEEEPGVSPLNSVSRENTSTIKCQYWKLFQSCVGSDVTWG